MNRKRCIAKTISGEPCAAYAQIESDYCFTHDPARAAERAEARRQGGYNRRTAHAGDAGQLPKAIRSIKDVYQVLDYTLAETIALDNGINRTRALISLSECYLHALEVGELEERVERLEEAQAADHEHQA